MVVKKSALVVSVVFAVLFVLEATSIQNADAQNITTRETVPAGSAAKRDKLIGKARLEGRRQGGDGLLPSAKRQPCAGEIGTSRTPDPLSQARSRVNRNSRAGQEQNTVITGDVVIDCR
ncbi:MAG: hypothetical protein ACMVY4_02445 [Minwuia sp.]|uniref:hypothetical protein n=1 Tax=Minwuia sp. TaxID=2493630 RepID=UPI003A84236E